MFTTGRLIFALVFFVLFILTLIWAYRKDMKQLKVWALKPWTVFLSLLAILLLYYFFSRNFI